MPYTSLVVMVTEKGDDSFRHPIDPGFICKRLCAVAMGTMLRIQRWQHGTELTWSRDSAMPTSCLVWVHVWKKEPMARLSSCLLLTCFPCFACFLGSGRKVTQPNPHPRAPLTFLPVVFPPFSSIGRLLFSSSLSVVGRWQHQFFWTGNSEQQQRKN